ncbi:mannose-1-phosphate guanylyltransferase/mannose-6-phosphate isomerase [Aestuariicella sp. G3-2]|uniref:mannose-1-phosphate guanylyltransferase/mannose-6-phosphate isomerase n=1 Tax=Pseudomaricurvus albidus TaxID=2842452 RepID=UPI001C0B74C2|nr:mannose-1-phosphate guanylyltransferase/mannose-6-phosphate isomerase [Aestuariicella albida]MBU3071654.1 mannose-1-phosphate guanylyltransferase/mannose-6-phosphate isomerase [Aestuariicella albida]
MLVPVILSGGAGSRLWPVSREKHPKPFMVLKDGESLLQKAFSRAVRLNGVKQVITVTNREFFFKSEDEYREVNATSIPTQFILEPVGRNTAAAIAAATLQVQKEHGDNTILLILTADHLINNQSAFADAVESAVKLAESDRIVTFGIQPERPETGYGYIEANGSEVLRFVEKPTLEVAQEYLAAGNYLWNAGMFCFKAGVMAAELDSLSTDIFTSVGLSLNEAQHSVSDSGLVSQIELPKSFESVPADSIDYAIMEKSRRMSVVSCDIGWSDIGSWDAVSGLNDSDQQGNTIIGDSILHDVKNCHIQSSGRLVGAVGLDNLVVVDTPDALLIADRNRSQEVKQIVSQLKIANHEAAQFHKTVHRPWGTYTVLEEGDNYKMKRIVVKPGASLSLQMHHHRSEHWIVVSGMAKVVNGEEEFMVSANESTYIPAGHKHRLANPGVTEVVLIEVQTGEYLGEDDIVRFQDNYGRCG